MHARLAIFAAATLIGSAAFAADPSSPPRNQPDQPQPRPAAIVLAAVDQVTPAEAEPQVQPAPRHRVARVTTCRCGDQQAQPEE